MDESWQGWGCRRRRLKTGAGLDQWGQEASPGWAGAGAGVDRGAGVGGECELGLLCLCPPPSLLPGDWSSAGVSDSPRVTREGRLSRIPEGEEQCVWEGGCGRKSRGKPPAVVRGPIKCERGGMLHPRRKLGALLNPIRGREDIIILGVYVPGGWALLCMALHEFTHFILTITLFSILVYRHGSRDSEK